MLPKITIALKTICDLSPELLAKHGIKGLLLDLDNTLTTHDNPRPADGVPEWISRMKENGIKMCIVSNNHEPRVKPFADALGLDFVWEGKKPLSKGFREAKEKMHLPWNDLAVVGDQIYTDVLGAWLKRLKCVYVFPIEHEKQWFLRLKRKIEKPFLPKKLTEPERNDSI